MSRSNQSCFVTVSARTYTEEAPATAEEARVAPADAAEEAAEDLRDECMSTEVGK